MAPPKRALFSLNYESDVQHLDQHVSRRSQDGEDGIKVFEPQNEREHTDLSYVTNPFEKTVNKAVNEVIQSTGKKVHSVEGDLYYTSQRSTSGSSTNRPNSTLSIKNKSTRRALERKYDISEL